MGIAGQKYDATLTDQLAIAVGFINLRVREGWEWEKWPEWTLSQERAFAEDWADTESYAEDEVVWDATTEAYYKSLQDANTGNAVTDAAWWEECDADDTEILTEQYGRDKIGRVWNVCDLNPQQYEQVRTYPHVLTADGLRVLGSPGTTVWVEFTKPAPRFSSRVHSTSETGYARYDIVFYPGTEDSDLFPDRGECYIAEVDDAGDQFWDKVDFPMALAQFVISAAGGDLLKHYGQRETGNEEIDRGYAALFAEARKVAPARRAAVSTRANG